MADNIVAARPASAVVLARPGARGGIEVYMVRRHIRSEFVPDAFVFPGGSVGKDDIATESIADLCAPVPDGPVTLGTGFRLAAIRECFEEAGVLLARRDSEPLAISESDVARFSSYRTAVYSQARSFADLARAEGLTFATDDLIHWAHWVTPERFPKRFDTHFFLAAMPLRQTAAHDRLETTDGVWIAPEVALERFHSGLFPIVFATIHQLGALTGFDSIETLFTTFEGRPVTSVRPVVIERDGQDVIVIPEPK